MLLQGATGELGGAVSVLLLRGVGLVATEASPGGSEPGSERLLLSWERKLKVSPSLLFR